MFSWWYFVEAMKHTDTSNRIICRLACFLFALMLTATLSAAGGSSVYVDYFIENGSPLDWRIAENGDIDIQLLYDHERNSPNRACIHWNFLVEGEKGSEQVLILHGFENIWNGMPGSAISEETSCYISPDGQNWKAIATEMLSDGKLKIRLMMESSSMQVARLQPYRISDLDKLEQSLSGSGLVGIIPIGRTVRGKELHILRIGNENAPHRIFIRARAHPWEPGGNWVLEGMIEEYLKGKDKQRFIDSYCLYLLPMANMDGVFYGRTRFNALGMDLNRKWDQPADPGLSPENHALELFLEELIRKGLKPDLGIDLHNDENGLVHISRPDINLDRYLKNMDLMVSLLREHTWFSEGTTGGDFRNPGSFGEGFMERYGIDAFIYELNANWIAGLNKMPEAADWKKLGRDMCTVFRLYFENLSN